MARAACEGDAERMAIDQKVLDSAYAWKLRPELEAERKSRQAGNAGLEREFRMLQTAPHDAVAYRGPFP
jgi:hypothetical protein